PAAFGWPAFVEAGAAPPSATPPSPPAPPSPYAACLGGSPSQPAARLEPRPRQPAINSIRAVRGVIGWVKGEKVASRPGSFKPLGVPRSLLACARHGRR